MQMRKLNLTDYTVQVTGEDGPVDKDYAVKDSICGILFSPQLEIGNKSLIERSKLADKLEAYEDDVILLTELEYALIKSSFDGITGFVRRDMQLVMRVDECELVDVDVTEKA